MGGGPGKAQGKKVDRRRCGSGDRGAAVLRPDQAKERPCGPRAEQHPREKTWRTSNRPAQEVRHSRRRKRNPGVEKGRRHDPTDPGRRRRPPQEHGVCRPERRGRPSKRCKGRRVSRSRGRSSHRADTQPIDDEAQAHPSLVAAASGSDAGPPATPVPAFGGTNSVMRAQAVPPTRIAPTTAKASRQPSDGTPICASPSVAW